MTIYEPVTDIGRAIAKALTRDDGIRLDIHDLLERWEPEYIADMEKAEKWDNLWLSERDDYFLFCQSKAKKYVELMGLNSIWSHDDDKKFKELLNMKKEWDKLSWLDKQVYEANRIMGRQLEAIKELTMGHHKDEQIIHPIKILKILEAEG